MAYKKQIFEILRELDGKDASARIAILRSNDSPTLRMVLVQNFDPTITYKLPEGEPPFKKQVVPIGYTENNLYADTRRLGYLFINPPKTIRKAQLEGLFISLLESLHPNECVVLLAVKDKKLSKVFNVTLDDVRQAFPGLLPIPVNLPEEALYKFTTEEVTPMAEKIKDAIDTAIVKAVVQKMKIRDLKGRAKTDSMIVPFV